MLHCMWYGSLIRQSKKGFAMHTLKMGRSIFMVNRPLKIGLADGDVELCY